MSFESYDNKTKYQCTNEVVTAGHLIEVPILRLSGFFSFNTFANHYLYGTFELYRILLFNTMIPIRLICVFVHHTNTQEFP